jgi:UDP-glucuronate decarboxylase
MYKIDEDLSYIFANSISSQKYLFGKKILLTGGTGFIGRWLLNFFDFFIKETSCDLKIDVISRNPDSFLKLYPHLSERFNFLKNDILNLKIKSSQYDIIIHGATDASADLNRNNPNLMFDTIVFGTKNILEYAKKNHIKNILFMSSGAVYGNKINTNDEVTENYNKAPLLNDPLCAYAEAKRAAEMMCTLYSKQYDLNISVARIFALLGPLLNLDIHFAAGNFIRDAINNKNIIVKSSGKAIRSYLYIADLIIFLLRLLESMKSFSPYNLGSEEGISVLDLAKKIADLISKVNVEVIGEADDGWNPGPYVPSVRKFYDDFNIVDTIKLDESIIRTAKYYGWNNAS